jgi:hypothetical protein
MLGNITGQVGHLNIHNNNNNKECYYDHLSVLIAKAKKIQTAFGYIKHSLYVQCAELLVELRQVSLSWLRDSKTATDRSKITAVLEKSKQLGLHPTTAGKVGMKSAASYTVNVKAIIKSTVQEVNLVQMELHNQSIIALCKNVVSSNQTNVGGPVANKTGSLHVFAHLDATVLKNILADIQNVHGGCKTKEATSYRKSIHCLMGLRESVLNLKPVKEGQDDDAPQVDQRARWTNVSVLIEQEEQKKDLLDLYLNEFTTIRNERNNSIMCSEMITAMKNNAIQGTVGDLSEMDNSSTNHATVVDTSNLETAIQYATDMVPVSDKAQHLLLISSDLLALRCAVNVQDWDAVEMQLRGMHDKDGTSANGNNNNNNTTPLKGIPASAMVPVSSFLCTEIKYITHELNNVRTCTYLHNALQENRYVGVDRNLHYDSIDEPTNHSAQQLQQCNTKDLEEMLNHALAIGPPRTHKSRALFVVAECVVHIRTALIAHQFESVYKALRPTGGFAKLLKVLHVNLDDEDEEDRVDEAALAWSDIVSHHRASSFNSMLVDYDQNECLALSSNAALSPPSFVANELIAARNEAEHVLSLHRLTAAIDHGGYGCDQVGELTYMLATKPPRAGMQVNRLKVGIALSEKCQVESKSVLVAALTDVARTVLSIRTSLINQDYDALELFLFNEQDETVHLTAVPPLLQHVNCYEASKVEHALSLGTSEIEKATYELWNYRTNEYLVSSCSFFVFAFYMYCWDRVDQTM